MIRVLFFFKFYYVFYAAIKNVTERVKRFRADCLSLFYSVESVCRKTLFEYEMVFRDTFFVKCFVKRL